MAEGYEIRIGKLHIGMYKHITDYYIGRVHRDEGLLICFWKFYIYLQCKIKEK